MANASGAHTNAVDEVNDRILRATIDTLRLVGLEALQIADVARQARVSLVTIYKCFSSRDGLLLAATERWMELQTYAPLASFDAARATTSREDLASALVSYFRRLFEPWEREPLMLEVFTQVRHGPGGERLRLQGLHAVEPVFRAMLKGLDRELRHDLLLIVANVHYGLVSRFSAGEIAVTDIMPAVERTIRRVLRE
jgi:TetR/AcrR family transcriptional regulator, cholesterol catabolism regulator